MELSSQLGKQGIIDRLHGGLPYGGAAEVAKVFCKGKFSAI